MNRSAEYASPTATSEMFFISTSTSTARSRSVIAGSSTTVGARHSGAPASSRSSAIPADGPRRISTSSGRQRVVAVGVDDPLLAAADRDDAHADLDRQLHVGERAVRERRLGTDPNPVRHLLGVGEVGDEGRRDAEVVGHDARDVDGRVRHAFDRRDDVEHARHLLGVARRAGRQHADLAHLVHEIAEPLFELVHLLGHVLVGEEERGIRQVDHELGGVLGLREHGLEVPWGFVFGHRVFVRRMADQVIPSATITRISDSGTEEIE